MLWLVYCACAGEVHVQVHVQVHVHVHLSVAPFRFFVRLFFVHVYVSQSHDFLRVLLASLRFFFMFFFFFFLPFFFLFFDPSLLGFWV